MSETAQQLRPEITAGKRLVLYAGRFSEQVNGADLPEGCTVLSEWEVLPARLGAILEETSVLVVLDIFSFPYEAMTGEQWSVPLVVVIPPDLDEHFLVSVFGCPLFERLVFFDRVVVRDDALWERLREKYGWAGGQRIEVESTDPGGVTVEVCRLLESESETPTFFGGDSYEAAAYWRERGDALADSSPYRAICSVHHDLAFNKAMHQVQAAVIEPQFAALQEGRAEDLPFDVLEVGCGIGRWAASFDLRRMRFCGLDISEGMVRAARANFPRASFEALGDELVFPCRDESFDLAFTVTVMHHNPTEAKRRLISEMWRVVRPGGRLMFLEDFVGSGHTEKSTVYPMSVLRFVDLLVEATDGRVVLEHVESLKYPHDDMYRGGLIAVTKVGVPQTW